MLRRASWRAAGATALALLLAAPAGAVVRPAGPGPLGALILPGNQPIGIASVGGRTMVFTPPDEVHRAIVQFRSPPLLARGGAAANRAGVESDHLGLARDLARAARPFGAAAPVAVRRSFQECFNGVAIEAPAAVIAQLRALPYVRAVFPDDSVHAAVDDNLRQIGADQAWSLGITGRGITVAIIDTGVDYTDEALGGGFGPGYRVVAGWDFINDDPDPMDDNLHGTHVAGIVGGNGGGVLGVAPDVTFHAYKVLDRFGAGTVSSVIAGIERAVDPDQDPTTNDHVDVMNLSLSGPGNADDPMAQAIDTASEAGVVCVIAAGNAGRYFSVGSPAAAREAVTVGAVDAQDRVAYFSSRGPMAGTYALKPDVTAPGVAIVSSIPGGRTAALSGTSMASPHVAGAAALVLQAHRDWPPRRVKAALMNTATPIAGGLAATGAGRIAVASAIAPAFVVEPPSISVPRPATLGTPYDVPASLTVTNVSADSETVALSVAGDPVAGLSARVDPPAVRLAPGDSATATFTVTIDPAGLAYPDTLPFLISGAVVARVGAVEHRVPFGLVRALQIALRSDPELPNFALIHDGLRERWAWVRPDGPPLALLSPGRFDVIAGFLPNAGLETAVVVREDVTLDHDDSLSFTRDDATLPIQIQPVDQAGRPFDVTLAELGLTVEGVFAMRLPAIDGHMRASPIGPAYRLEWDHFAADAGVFQESRGAQRGLSQPTLFRNDAADVRRFPLALKTDGTDPQTVFHFRWFRFGALIVGFEYIFPGFAHSAIDLAGVLPRGEPSLSLGFSERIASPTAVNADAPFAITPLIDVFAPGRVTGSYGPDLHRHIFDVPAGGFRLDLDAGPPVWIGGVSFSDNTLYLFSQFSELRARLFMSPLGGIADGPDPSFWMIENGAVADSGMVTDAGRAAPAAGEFRHAISGAGPHRCVIQAPSYAVGDTTGTVRVTADLGADPSDRHLPTFRQITVLADGVQTDSVVFDRTAGAELRVLAFDAEHLARVAAWIAPSGSEAWRALGAGADSSLGFALPDTLDGWMALRIEASDAAGNRIAWVADPAYHSSARITAFVRAAAVETTPASVTLRWTVPSGDTGPFTVYRKGVQSDWTPVGATTAESGNRARFTDAVVTAGRRYAYAIGIPSSSSGVALLGSTWVDVPGARPVLFGILPNPGPGNVRVSFSLGSNAPATLDLIDVAGRQIRRLEVGSLGAGEHSVDLGAGLTVRAGIYWVRLEQSGVRQAMRAAVIH